MPTDSPKLFALFVGINAYQKSPLEGCINDVLATRDYFQKLCAAQENHKDTTVEPVFRYLLAPLDEAEIALLSAAGLEPGTEDRPLWEAKQYYRPTRDNIIRAFDELFSQADPQRGDFCLLYYSGHGSMMEAPAIFSEVEPTGAFQTLTLLDSREAGQRDLIDKELGYLIAKTMEGKAPKTQPAIPGVHFLTIMDCCNSGSNTRADEPDSAVRRMRSGPDVKVAEHILGFTTEGNCFYEKAVLRDGRPKIPWGGLKHGRHISLAASRDAETAKEKGIYLVEKAASGQKKSQKKRHGVFTYSLLRTLEEGGTHITYGELIRRVQVDVRGRTENQIPVLGKTIQAEEDLLFLDNRFATPAREYVVSFRKGNWYLDAGTIHGIVPGRQGEPTTVKVKVKTKDGQQAPVPERLVAIREVGVTESTLDDSAFQNEDWNRLLAATIHTMPFPRIKVGFGDQLPEPLKNPIRSAFARNHPEYAALVPADEVPDYLIKSVPNEDDEPSYVLTRPGSDIPLFTNRNHAAIFLRDVNKVGKWSGVLKMDNSDAAALKEHRKQLRIEAKVLEGYPFDSKSFNEIPNTAYNTLPPNPKAIHLAHEKAAKDGKLEFTQPALRLKVSNLSEEEEYWVGALYLNSKFGINHNYTEVKKLSADENNTYLELQYQEKNGKTYRGIPVALDKDYHQLGITEITDYVMIFVSSKPFDLSQYQQQSLPVYREKQKREGFEEEEKAKKDFWFTIKIPVHIRYPIETIELPAAATKALGGIRIESPADFSATLRPTTRANARRLITAQEKTRSPLNEKALLPPGELWMQAEQSDAVFSRGLANADPEDYVSTFELTNVNGELTADAPLVITPPDPLPATEAIVPFAYDADHDLYYPVGYTNEAGQVIIAELPEPTPGFIGNGTVPDEQERGLRDSIKLFFHKVVWSKLSGRHDYHTLALFSKNAAGTVNRTAYKNGTAYQEQREQIRTALSTAPGDILLLVHGLIGDTDDMVAAVFETTALHQRFGSVLGFVYENLNTPIEEAAQQLAAMLTDCGVTEKRLVVVAHSMGGLVARRFIEHAGGEQLVKRLIQVGTPNNGAVLASLRKRISTTLLLALNGVERFAPYTTLASFIWKGIGGQLFKTTNQMDPAHPFIRELNSPGKPTPDTPYALIAGNTQTIEAEMKKNDPVWKKIWAGLRDRGHYLFFDRAFFGDEPNDWIVRVDSMQGLPWPHREVATVSCDHFSYFDTEVSLEALDNLFDS